MHKTLSRALGATRNYFTARPLLQAFVAIGAADALGQAAMAALGIQA